MFTLILTIYSNAGCCVNHIPGFETYDLACRAGDEWVSPPPAIRSYIVVKMSSK